MSITEKKYPNVLKPAKQRGFSGKIYGFDIETCDSNKKFVCASIYENEHNKWTFRDRETLISFLKTKRFKNSVIAATNLAFDFFGVFHKTREIMEFNTLFRGSDLVYAKSYIWHRDFHKKSYDGESRETRKYKGGRILFLDTFNYCKMSVEKLGNILDIPKMKKPDFLGEMPKDENEWDELAEYNMQDSRISKKYIEFLFNAFQELGATPKPTIASTAMSLFKNKYLDREYYVHSNEDLKEQFEAYYGGRTEAFARGRIKGYNYYDFNSLYPSVMRMAFPDPNSKRISSRNSVEYIKKYEGVSKVSVFCPQMKYPLLPFRTKDKLVFGYGNFTGWYSHVELRRAMELGYVIKKVHKTHYFKRMCTPFRAYVEEMYSLRKKYRECGNRMEKVVKLLMNSLYGKFGQKFTDRDNWIPFNLTMEELDKLESFERIGDFIRVKQGETMPACFCFPIWALYTTAYARLKMHVAIQETNPVYVDTDSLITKSEIETSPELGALKREMSVSDGYVVKPKFYAFIDERDMEHVRIKGIGKKIIMDEFRKILLDPSVIYTKFMKFKESMRRGFVPNEIIQVSKSLNLEDNKRNWEHDFNPLKLEHSLPLEIIEGMTEHEYRKAMLKADKAYERMREKHERKFIESDLFDSASVGHDISKREFLANEKDWNVE